MLNSLFKSQETSNILVIPKDIKQNKLQMVGMGYKNAEKLYDDGDHFTAAFYSKPNFQGNVFYFFGYGEVGKDILEDMDEWDSDEFDRKSVKSIRVQDKNNHKSWLTINNEEITSNVPFFDGTINSLIIDTNNKDNLENFCFDNNDFEHKNFIIACTAIIILLMVVFVTFVCMKLIRTRTCYRVETPKWDKL
jgi:hypothetical protein